MSNDRKQSITYDATTGRIAESDGFAWEYLAGTNLKSSLTYPNEDVVSWTYEPHRDLLTTVTNATYSTYTYTNDLLGRRTSKNNEQYGYNVRDELIAADEVSYNYDDIGNRTTAEGKTYIANNLNQYTAIDDFVPQYDADGNQTLIKTETGIWSVIYNAENRPIRWESGDTVITMAFDRMGRRVEMCTVKNGEESLQRFVYDNYLCVQQLRGADNALFQSYVWDPTEPIATRPLIFIPSGGEVAYYFHDGNKNVTDLTSTAGTHIHYVYTPFGISEDIDPLNNPYRFSSEKYDGEVKLTYYNYRHYSYKSGRFLSYDPAEEYGNLYLFIQNSPTNLTDIRGLIVKIRYVTPKGEQKELELPRSGKAEDLIKMLETVKQEEGKICEFYCGGHGSYDRIFLNGVWGGFSVLTKETTGSLILKVDESNVSLTDWTEVNGKRKWEHKTITAALNELLATDALINFNGCLTACEWRWMPDENIAKKASKLFPNVRVKGSRGFAAGFPWGQEPFLRFSRTYINGVEQ